MSQYLPLAVKNVSITLENILNAMAKQPSYKQEYFDRIMALYRQQGIGDFLVSNSSELLFSKLTLGVQASIDFLTNADTGEPAASKITTFFDAVCCQDFPAMEKLAQLSPRKINSRIEYEEDYLYCRILMDVFGLRKNQEDIQDLLEEFEALHADNPDHRYTVLMALLEKDGDAFHEVLEFLIDAYKDHYVDGGDMYAGTQDEAIILAHVSIEIIALVQLARMQGIATYPEYALAPKTALASCSVPEPPPGAWLHIDSRRSFSFQKP
ncbi:immunity 49 family protein [Agarilytica rhodophyticola]|uniref:immunity 49 family protein n=1 Tax=Agarilytica rhodophyticola TaxID=1737490 RepID=UPI000B346C84|nr:immunity 49 family protein [Agarilytica rhodophyticola]